MYLSKRNGVYYIFYKQLNGKKTCKSTKATSKKEAFQYLLNFKNVMKEKEKDPSPTLKEFYKCYLDKMEVSLMPNSWRYARNALTYLMNEVGDTIRIGDISTTMIENFLLKKFKESKYSAHSMYRNLKAAFNKAVLWELIEKNPLRRIKLPKIETNYPAYINEDQLNLIIEKETNIVLKSNYAIAFYTGMRLSEGVNLRWKDVDMINKIIYVRNSEHHTTKSKNERIIPYGNKVDNYLKTLVKRNEEDFIFSFNGKNKFHWNKLSKLFKVKVREAGLDDSIHYHSLRHSFASNLVSKGVAIYTVQKLMGHSSITVTSIYSHLSNQNLVDAVKVFD